MDVKQRTKEIIKANPPITYDELVQELNRTLIDELQEALGELLKSGEVIQPKRHYYLMAEKIDKELCEKCKEMIKEGWILSTHKSIVPPSESTSVMFCNTCNNVLVTEDE